MSREMKRANLPGEEYIPESWETPRLKDNAYFINGDRGKNYPSGEDIKTEGIPFLTSDNIHSSIVDIARDGAKYITEEKYNSMHGAKLRINDLIYCLRGSVGLCALNKELTQGTIASSLVVIRPKATVIPEFLNYVMNSAVIQQQNDNYMNGSCAANLSAENVRNYNMPFPQIEEQKAIVSFLSVHCAYVDSAISKHQQIIEKLEEYRKAVITQAVTKGLNPNVEMKDSGNMIIGTIPSSWQCPPLKMLLSDNENNMRVGPFGSSLPSRIFQDDGPWVYNQRCVLDNNFEATDVHIPEWKFEEMKSFAVYPGDMLITTRGTIGKVAIVPHDAKKGILHPCLIRFRLDNAKILNEYVQYVFNGTDIVMNQIKQASGSTTIEALYSGPLRSIKLPTPSVEEQHYIVSWLNIKCKKIAKTIEAHNQLISKLQEYRQSLIYNAVTGKIDCTTEASA